MNNLHFIFTCIFHYFYVIQPRKNTPCGWGIIYLIPKRSLKNDKKGNRGDEQEQKKKKKQKHKFTTRGHVAFPLPQLDAIPKKKKMSTIWRDSFGIVKNKTRLMRGVVQADKNIIIIINNNFFDHVKKKIYTYI